MPDTQIFVPSNVLKDHLIIKLSYLYLFRQNNNISQNKNHIFNLYAVNMQNISDN